MPRDLSGNFQRLRKWADDAGDEIPLSPERLDEDADDMAAAINDTYPQSVIDALLAGKVDQSDFDALANLNADDVSAAAFAALQTTVAGKADSSTVTALASTVSGKADSSTVTALATTVAGKADTSALSGYLTPSAHDSRDHRTPIRAYAQANQIEAQQDIGLYVVESVTTSLPSIVPADGTAYLLSAAAPSNANKVAIVESGAWAYKTAVKGFRVLAKDTDAEWYYDGAAWATITGTGSSSGTAATNTDGRVLGYAITNGHGGNKWRAHWTSDQRIIIYGDQGVFAYEPAGDNWLGFVVAWDRANNGNIVAMYAGINYLLILTDQSTGNLYHMGATDNGQGGMAATSGATLVPTRITKFVTDAVKIASVVTEATVGNSEKAWFAITTGGNVYSCGYAGAQQCMGYNSTTNLSTPRKMTQSDGSTPLANIDAIAFSTVYAPVWAHTTANEAWRWGAGTDGAHGNNNTTALSWPAKLETSVGSGVARTDIAQIAVSGYSTRAVSWIRTTAGKIESSGSRTAGNGDGAALLGSAVNTFQTASGAIAALTVSQIIAGGGDNYAAIAITSLGLAYLVGTAGSIGALGNTTTTNLNTWTVTGTLPSGFSGAITGGRVAGTSTTLTFYLEATISGVKKLASIGSDSVYQTGKGTTGVTAGSQTWGLVLGAQGNIASWQTVGDGTTFGLEVLDADGVLWYCGGNDQGQSGCQPGNIHSVVYLQPCIPALNRQQKAPTSKGAYAGGTTYAPQDWVTYQGSSWLCILATTGNAPPTLPTTSNTYWTLFAQKGDAGYFIAGFDFDGGTSALATGMKGRFYIPFDGTISEATIISDAVGSIVFDVWKDTYANYPPTVADTITASAKPTLSSANKSQDSTLTGWTKTVSAGDILIANIDSVSGISNAVLTLKVQRS